MECSLDPNLLRDMTEYIMPQNGEGGSGERETEIETETDRERVGETETEGLTWRSLIGPLLCTIEELCGKGEERL